MRLVKKFCEDKVDMLAIWDAGSGIAAKPIIQDHYGDGHERRRAQHGAISSGGTQTVTIKVVDHSAGSAVVTAATASWCTPGQQAFRR